MKHHAWQGQGKWWIGLAGLLLAALLLLPAVTAAQDDTRPDPDAPDQFVFLPFVQSGPAPEPVAGDVIPGQYIVVLQPPEVRAANNAGGQVLDAAAIAAQVAEVFGGQILYTYESAIEGFAAVLPEDAVAKLEQNPDIAYVEADRVVTIVDTQLNPPWGLDRIDQRDRPLSGSYTYNAAGVGVHAYVIDTGIRSTHNEFGGRVSNGYTAIFDGRGTGDCNGHGTHVAGTVGGATYGVAKQVTLHPVRVLGCNGSGTTAGVIAGVDWVTANHTKPAVANMSLGGSASTSLDNAVRNSIAAGVTYALAAGNENANACLSSPARTAEALTVGASTSSDSRASFSNYGTCVDIFAPGSSILSAYYTSDFATATLSGTSMASPHVAGAAALYLSTTPNASPAQVAQALIDNASLNKLSSIGSGSPNRLLYTAFVGGGTPPTFTPTATSTPLPTATPTFTPTPLPTSTPTPTPTPTGQPTAQPTPTPTPTVTPTQPPAACTNLLQNGDFEQGRTVWSESSTHGYALICNQTSCGPAISPHRGQYLSWLGGANNEISEIRQPVTLPAGQNAYLSYWYDIESNDYCGYDYGYVRVIVDGVTRTLKRYSLCWSAETNGWANAQLDLSQYAGKTVTVVFRSTTDYSYSSSLFVDDVALTTAANCTAGLGPVEQVTELGGEDVSSAVAKPATPAGAAEHER